MDTLSVKIPTTLHHPARTQINNYFPQQITKQKTPNKVSSSSSSSNKTNHFIINPPPPPPLLNSSSHSQPPPPTSKTPKLPQPTKKPQESHQSPSTGYAAALLDAARCNHALDSVSRDVRRLSRWLRVSSSVLSDPCVGNKEKGEIVKAIVGKGNFHRYLSRLVNLLVQKSNFGVEMVKEMLVEFGRIYDELMMEEEEVVVLVSPGLKMGTDQVWGVAQRVQNISGAVRVTVRQLL